MHERPGPVLITGANSGIGLSTALRLASRGWDVWGTVRTAAKGDDLVAEAAKAGVGAKVSIVEPGFFRTGIDARPADKAKELAARQSSPYRAAYERATDGFTTAGRFAPPASIVARTISSAIENRRPLRRYLVGFDAVAVTAAERLLPRELTDNMARMMTGLMTPPGTRGVRDE